MEVWPDEPLNEFLDEPLPGALPFDPLPEEDVPDLEVDPDDFSSCSRLSVRHSETSCPLGALLPIVLLLHFARALCVVSCGIPASRMNAAMLLSENLTNDPFAS